MEKEKISIVVPCYGTEKYLSKCLDSIINQSYNNLEIVVVNDCSPDNTAQILDDYSKKDNRIKVVNNKTNQGLYKTRIIGSKECTGDYIAFVDSDDFISCDYYRTLLYNLKKNSSDIVIGNFVTKAEKIEYIYNYIFHMEGNTLEGEKIYNKYFEQEGSIYKLHVVWNKLIKMNVWKSAIKDFEMLTDRIVMTEDFVFSTILYYYAKKISFCDESIYYYCEHLNQSTSFKKITAEKLIKNIKDIIISFDYIKSFLKRKKISKYDENINNWEAYYIDMHYSKLKGNLISDEDKKEVLKAIKKSCNFDKYLTKDKLQKMMNHSGDNFTYSWSKYNDGLEKIKKEILNKEYNVVSFDMFDTLVTRPFYKPTDLFELLNEEYTKLTKCITVVNFSKTREYAEQSIRNKKYKEEIYDVTIDNIYDEIYNMTGINKTILKKLKEKELKLEERFCRKRETGYQLYLLAKSQKKKVIVTSDIYLPRKTIMTILAKEGYDFDKVYISSELNMTKSNGTLYEKIIEDNGNKIIHIGDNYESDYKVAKNHDINALYLPRTVEVMMHDTSVNTDKCGRLFEYYDMFNIDVRRYLETFGVRCSIAVIANKYFDNPFVDFPPETSFNADPTFVGYYGLGMHLLSLANWILHDASKKNIDTIAFMARDGLIPMKACEILQNNTEISNNSKLKYVYVSRKALMPIVMTKTDGPQLISTYLDHYKMNEEKLSKSLKYVISYKNTNQTDDTRFENRIELNNCTKKIFDKYYDKEKYDDYKKLATKYFQKVFEGKPATFDIGYSGKPESIITSLIGKPLTTYFIHTNTSEGYKNAYLSNYDINNFYDFKPTMTGTLREILFSDIGPSCIGYEKSGDDVKPVFSSKEKYNYFNKYIINTIQNSALKFVEDFSNIFGEYMEMIDLNKFYMSIPYEYYLHYSMGFDKEMTRDMIFETNTNNFIEINDFIDDDFKNYNIYYNKRLKVSEETLKCIRPMLLEEGYGPLPKSRFGRIFYYVFFDRKEIGKKINVWKCKKNDPYALPNNKFKRGIYYILFDRKKIKNKILRKNNEDED